MPVKRIRAHGTDAIKELLMWARENRFALSSVKLGDCEISIAADLGLAPGNISLGNPREETDLIEKFGGNGLARLRQEIQPYTELDE